MLNKKVEEALNAQINAELFSSYLYLSMSAYFESANFKGFANWMKVQAQEEMVHANKFFEYIHDRRGRVLLAPVDGPATEWGSPLEAFQGALAHEQKVTERINNLVAIAREQKDNATEIFLQWFVTEQVEEEASADAVIQQLNLMKGSTGALFWLDRELGKRAFGGGE